MGSTPEGTTTHDPNAGAAGNGLLWPRRRGVRITRVPVRAGVAWPPVERPPEGTHGDQELDA
eukprot:11149366-Heterocapsa_arctica.AAC.1